MVVVLLLGGVLPVVGSTRELQTNGLSLASRMLNQFTTVVVTSIALIIPLSSNLYSPRLVRLYVTHPIIVVSLIVLLVTHLLFVTLGIIPPTSRASRPLLSLAFAFVLVVMAGLLPFLFGVSQFLRPTFFMPMLTRKAVHSLQGVMECRRVQASAGDLFEITDVVANIALTGMTRGDRQLVLLSLQSLHTILMELVGAGARIPPLWKGVRPHYVPGLAREGQLFIAQEGLWPEAYLLAQILRTMEAASKRQHELLAELADQLVQTAELAAVLGRGRVVELHLMVFNALLRESIEARDLRRFQNLSYHYRLLIEAIAVLPEFFHQAMDHMIAYGRLAEEEGMGFGLKTVIFDLAELTLSLASSSEERAVEMVQLWVGPLIQDAIQSEGTLRMVGWRALLKVYWEARERGLGSLADCLYWRHLSDGTVHRERIELVLDEDRELHAEFNDRLMRFAHLSPGAADRARAFAEE